MSKHTPGPWAVVERKIPWSMDDGASGDHVERIIVTGWDHPQAKGPISIVSKWLGIGLSGGPGVQFVRIQEADAHLIAAAPDLLEALEACIDYGAMTGDDWVMDKARAAIAKATALAPKEK